MAALWQPFSFLITCCNSALYDFKNVLASPLVLVIAFLAISLGMIRCCFNLSLVIKQKLING